VDWGKVRQRIAGGLWGVPSSIARRRVKGAAKSCKSVKDHEIGKSRKRSTQGAGKKCRDFMESGTLEQREGQTRFGKHGRSQGTWMRREEFTKIKSRAGGRVKGQKKPARREEKKRTKKHDARGGRIRSVRCAGVSCNRRINEITRQRF